MDRLRKIIEATIPMDPGMVRNLTSWASKIGPVRASLSTGLPKTKGGS